MLTSLCTLTRIHTCTCTDAEPLGQLPAGTPRRVHFCPCVSHLLVPPLQQLPSSSDAFFPEHPSSSLECSPMPPGLHGAATLSDLCTLSPGERNRSPGLCSPSCRPCLAHGPREQGLCLLSLPTAPGACPQHLSLHRLQRTGDHTDPTPARLQQQN